MSTDKVKRRIYAKRHRDKCIAEKVCYICGKPVLDRTRCDDCLQKERERAKAYAPIVKQRRIEAGYCVGCGKRDPMAGTLYCGYCLELRAENNRRYRGRIKQNAG